MKLKEKRGQNPKIVNLVFLFLFPHLLFTVSIPPVEHLPLSLSCTMPSLSHSLIVFTLFPSLLPPAPPLTPPSFILIIIKHLIIGKYFQNPSDLTPMHVFLGFKSVKIQFLMQVSNFHILVQMCARIRPTLFQNQPKVSIVSQYLFIFY